MALNIFLSFSWMGSYRKDQEGNFPGEIYQQAIRLFWSQNFPLVKGNGCLKSRFSWKYLVLESWHCGSALGCAVTPHLHYISIWVDSAFSILILRRLKLGHWWSLYLHKLTKLCFFLHWCTHSSPRVSYCLLSWFCSLCLYSFTGQWTHF